MSLPGSCNLTNHIAQAQLQSRMHAGSTAHTVW
jgi:hypothetical protein